MANEDALYGAVKYFLDRLQTDPDVYWFCGPGTQVFSLMCEAEAAHLGRDVEQVKTARMQDLQPAHRKREPEVERLRDLVDRLRRGEAA